MRPSGPNANALMSSSMVCNGFSRSTSCAPAGGIVQHPKKTHTSAHTPRSHRVRLEQRQFTSCLESSLRFEYAHHQTQFNYSPSRKLVANFGTRKSVELYRHFTVRLISRTRLEKDVHSGATLFSNSAHLSNPAQSLKPAAIFPTRLIFQTPPNLSNPAQSFKPRRNLSNPTRNSHSERSRPTISSAFAPAKASVCAVEESLFDPARSQAMPLHTHHSLIPSPPLAPSPSEFPPTSAAIALQTPDPSACSTSAPPNSPANKSCP